jgi:hypothetical protein
MSHRFLARSEAAQENGEKIGAWEENGAWNPYRGGSFTTRPAEVFTACGRPFGPALRISNVGFRVARTFR